MVTRMLAQEAQLLAQDVAESMAHRAAKMGDATEVAQKAAKEVSKAVGGSLGLTGERMSKVDTAWLRMDTPENLMMIVGVWVLRPGVTLAAMRERVEAKLLQYNRFKQRVIEDAAGATWVTDKRFDIDNHVVAELLKVTPEQSAQDALQERVAQLATRPLVRTRPLWQMHVVENYPLPEGGTGSAMIARIHHCIADGIALISVIMSLMDGGQPPPKREPRPISPEDWLSHRFIKPFADASLKAFSLANHLAQNFATSHAARGLQMFTDPEALQNTMTNSMAQGMDMAKMGGKILTDLASLALMPDDSPTSLKGKPGSAKQVAWCAPIPLDEVKKVGQALGCSINDILLSCVAGAIGQYLSARGEEIQGKEIRAMVPVNLRPIDQAHKLGNRFGLAPLVLPISIEDPVKRVFEVRQRMNQLKQSYQPLLAFSLLAVAGMLIKPAQDAMLSLFSKKTTAVMTNVPGPREKHQLLGSTIEEMMFWVPQSGDVGMGVSILSYAGGVQFGLITDAGLCPKPQEIIDEFAIEFAKLAMITLMLPWEGEAA